MTVISQQQNPLQIGDAVIDEAGNKTFITTQAQLQKANANLQPGDIVCSESGTIVQINAGGKEEILLDGDNLTTSAADDASAFTTAGGRSQEQADANYEGFWARMFGKANVSQDDTLRKVKATNDAKSGDGHAVRFDNTDKNYTSGLPAAAANGAATSTGNTTVTSTKQAAQILYNDPAFADGANGPKYLDRAALIEMYKNSKDPKTRAAISYLLNNPAAFDTIDGRNNNGKLDGKIGRTSLGKVAGYTDDKEKSFSAAEMDAEKRRIDNQTEQNRKDKHTTSSPPPPAANYSTMSPYDPSFYNKDGTTTPAWRKAYDAAKGDPVRQDDLVDAAQMRKKGFDPIAVDPADPSLYAGSQYEEKWQLAFDEAARNPARQNLLTRNKRAHEETAAWNAVPVDSPRFFNADGSHTEDWEIARAAAVLSGDKNRVSALDSAKPPVPTKNPQGVEYSKMSAYDPSFYNKDGTTTPEWDKAYAAATGDPVRQGELVDAAQMRKKGFDPRTVDPADASLYKGSQHEEKWQIAFDEAAGDRPRQNLLTRNKRAHEETAAWNAVPVDSPRFFNADGSHTEDWEIARAAAVLSGDTGRVSALDGAKPPVPTKNPQGVEYSKMSAYDPSFYNKDGTTTPEWDKAYAAAAGDPVRQGALVDAAQMRKKGFDPRTVDPADPSLYKGSQHEEKWQIAFDEAAGDQARQNLLTRNKRANEETATWNAVPVDSPRFFNPDGSHTEDWEIARAAAVVSGDTNRVSALDSAKPPAPTKNPQGVEYSKMSAYDPSFYKDGKTTPEWDKAYAAAKNDPVRQGALVDAAQMRQKGFDPRTVDPADPSLYAGSQHEEKWKIAFDEAAGDRPRQNLLTRNKRAHEETAAWKGVPANDPRFFNADGTHTEDWEIARLAATLSGDKKRVSSLDKATPKEKEEPYENYDSGMS
ncbi:MAG: hypothetical protein H7315_03125 [Herminiimonas sp.]|nr:hypothetical protein [Herminiimonas sp.]